MAIVSLVGVDAAGGVITGPGAPTWTWNGSPISLVGDGVAAHGRDIHQGPVIVQGSPWMRINGIPVTRQGSAANCGHTASGSSQMNIP